MRLVRLSSDYYFAWKIYHVNLIYLRNFPVGKMRSLSILSVFRHSAYCLNWTMRVELNSASVTWRCSVLSRSWLSTPKCTTRNVPSPMYPGPGNVARKMTWTCSSTRKRTIAVKTVMWSSRGPAKFGFEKYSRKWVLDCHQYPTFYGNCGILVISYY